jgi:hypothetical protein
MYTNEAGFDVFQTALKQDALNSGLTFTADSETDLCKVLTEHHLQLCI